MPVLIVKFEGSVLQKVSINGGSITIGRGPDNSIPIDNLAVSNHHAEIRSEEGHLVIQDLDSLNGTFVNNQRVKRSALKHGDVVLIGKHSIQVDGFRDVSEPVLGQHDHARAAPLVISDQVAADFVDLAEVGRG